MVIYEHEGLTVNAFAPQGLPSPRTNFLFWIFWTDFSREPQNRVVMIVYIIYIKLVARYS